jgi:hypothetical protein
VWRRRRLRASFDEPDEDRIAFLPAVRGDGGARVPLGDAHPGVAHHDHTEARLTFVRRAERADDRWRIVVVLKQTFFCRF